MGSKVNGNSDVPQEITKKKSKGKQDILFVQILYKVQVDSTGIYTYTMLTKRNAVEMLGMLELRKTVVPIRGNLGWHVRFNYKLQQKCKEPTTVVYIRPYRENECL